MKPNHRSIYALFAAIAATFPLHAQPKQASEKPAAVVNGEAISRADFDKAMARVPAPPTGLDEDQRKAARLDLLQMMIDDLLFQQFLRKNVPAPDTGLVERRVKELERSLQASGHTLQDYYRDTGQTDARVRADITAAIQWNAYVRKYGNDSDLRRCYEDNRELFDGAALRASHVALRVLGDAKPKVHEAAQKKLRAIREEILNGLDFAQAARKYSEDKTSAAQGGDLGYFPPRRNDTDPFIRVASALKVGQVSDIVQTEFSYHLIKLTDRKAGKPSTFEEVKEDVRLLWADELRAKIIAEQRKAGKIDVNLP